MKKPSEFSGEFEEYVTEGSKGVSQKILASLCEMRKSLIAEGHPDSLVDSLVVRSITRVLANVLASISSTNGGIEFEEGVDLVHRQISELLPKLMVDVLGHKGGVVVIDKGKKKGESDGRAERTERDRRCEGEVEP